MELNEIMRIRKLHVLALSMSLSQTLMLQVPVFCQTSESAEDGSSLESMWSEEAGKTDKNKKTESSKKSKSEAKAKMSDLGDAGAVTPSDTSKPIPLDTSPAETTRVESPLCTIASFKESELVKTSCWPGIGPFQGQNEGRMEDPQENKLHYRQDGDKLTRAELLLVGQNHDAQSLLNLQMATAYMLEALGAKNKRIAEFNAFLEKNKQHLSQKESQASISTTSGPYAINLKNTTSDGAHAYLIEIHKRGEEALGESLIALSSAGESRHIETEPVKEPQAAAKVKPAPSKTLSTPVKQPPTKTATVKPPTTPVKATPLEEVRKPETASQDSLKQELQETLRSWQNHKKDALKERQTEELSKYLSGRALGRQKDGIKWLVDNKKYYDMVPRGVTVDKYQQLSAAPPRYLVTARVKELSKLVDEATKQVMKESEDSYNVNYTLEKSGNSWTISDSQLIAGAKGKK